MSPRFRRYLVRSLPALFLMLLLFWVFNRIWGGYSVWYGFIFWAVIFGMKWAIRTEPHRRE